MEIPPPPPVNRHPLNEQYNINKNKPMLYRCMQFIPYIFSDN